MKLIKHLIVLLFLSVLPIGTVWAADACAPTATVDHDFVDGTPYNGSGNTGSGKEVYYYFTVPGSGRVTFTNPIGDVTFDYDTALCPTTSSSALVDGSFIDFAAAGDFNMLVASGPANKDFTFTMEFEFDANQIPVATDDAAESRGTEPTVISILANDYDIDGTLDPSTVTIVSDVTNGTTDINTTTGDVTYTPTTFAGTDSFTYTVQDNEGAVSVVATVTITYPIPIAYDRAYTVVPGGTIVGNAITDTPVCENWDDNLSMNANTIPAVGTITPTTIGADGDFNYTADNSIYTTSFTYSIKNDFNMTSNDATITIYVNEYCANALTILSTDTNCSTTDTNSTSGSVTEDGAQYYKFELAENGLLDINLTNTDGSMILYYDFTIDSDTCGTLFAKGTTSQLDSGYPTKSASILLDAGTYYLGVQGKSNLNATDYNVSTAFHSACAGDDPLTPYVAENVGINEVYMDYDDDKNITTKIVDKLFNLKASYLDASGAVATYDGSYGNNKIIDMTVIAEHADGDTCTDNKPLGQALLLHNTQSTILSDLIIEEAYKNRRVKITAFDYAALLEDASGLNCANSSLNSTLCLVPACFNNVQNIRSVFPPAFQPGVMLCIYGDGSGKAPCDSDAYYGSCGGKKSTISPSAYNHDLGCAMCLADAMAGNLCSRDEFAIRPDQFSSTITANQIFGAGVPPSPALTFYANKFGGVGTPQYDEAENTSFVVDVNISDASKACQDMSINFDPAINFNEGVVTDTYRLNNVGDFNLTMHETIGSEYALVDADDTNDTDRLITPFTQQIKVIPDHFGIDGNFTNGSNGFTYLNNFDNNATLDQNISALMDWNITAQTQANATTTNYTSSCYAKDGNITLTLTLTQAISDLNQSLSKMLWYDDDNNTIIGSVSINDPFILPNYTAQRFEPGDSNGTGNFRYRLNFDRNVSKVVNPFRMTIADLNATDTDGVSGSNALSDNATYVYGRTHASRQRYQGNSGTANIYFEAYCFGTTCNQTLLNGFAPNLRRTDDIRWFYNEGSHDTSVDGNIGTVQQRDATPLNSADDVVDVTAQRNNLNPSEADLQYDGTIGYPYKTTMHNDASPWLIYNEDDPTATRNEFQVEFSITGGWSGEHETDTTTKDVGNVNTNRRVIW